MDPPENARRRSKSVSIASSSINVKISGPPIPSSSSPKDEKASLEDFLRTSHDAKSSSSRHKHRKVIILQFCFLFFSRSDFSIVTTPTKQIRRLRCLSPVAARKAPCQARRRKCPPQHLSHCPPSVGLILLPYVFLNRSGIDILSHSISQLSKKHCFPMIWIGWRNLLQPSRFFCFFFDIQTRALIQRDVRMREKTEEVDFWSQVCILVLFHSPQ